MLVNTVVRMHQALNSIDSIVMAEDSVNSCAAITLILLDFTILSWDQIVEKLTYLHVLSDI